MVVSNILGGMGNQMFQYAAGRSLALATNQKFMLDLNDFSRYQLHYGFELSGVFNVHTESASKKVVNDLLGWRSYYPVRRVLRRSHFTWLRGSHFVGEPHFNYWTDFINLTGNCYLQGYWQSERYFKSFESIIRQDFTFREPLMGINLLLATEIAQVQSVSLHVRRGDYVHDPKNCDIMEICSLDYYHKSICYIAERIERPVFYIFSDDMIWVRQNFNVNFPCIYIEHNHGAESYRDMQLMSLCKHHIIANSSFSWWGAWLNSNSEKLVIAPMNWFRNGADDRDLIPENWVRL
jgi:hypothetical protein